ncbi:unnamed protein product, partial [Thelazia callipaeda]|uniref:AB hydrolase-1 domain-containing protein n=1 Tax=Thelazia callipaeda TaxID=103827 RepID=A0A0N5DAQ2_THECL
SEYFTIVFSTFIAFIRAVSSTYSSTGRFLLRFSSSAKRCLEELARTIRSVLMYGPSAIDLALRRILLLSKFFTNSWGNPETLATSLKFRTNVMSNGGIMEIVEHTNPKMEATSVGNHYMEGYFISPLASLFPDLLPGNIGQATWRGKFSKIKNALVIHLAGTGDHTYFRREFGFANDLLKSNISSILLQNPFYGSRKPRDQFRSSLTNVSDLFVMGGALVSECNFLLKWAKGQGYWPLGLAGVSMGGHMACLACTNFPEPIALVPCLSWTTASTVFVEGTLSKSVSWDVLAMELQTKKFRDGIRQIPKCDWLDKAYEYQKNLDSSPFSAAKSFMYVLMEEFTNLKHYPIPKDTRLVKNIIAENDGYIIRKGVPTMQEVWPGSTVQVIKGLGHVEAYLVSHTLFRNCIREMLQKNQRLYT